MLLGLLATQAALGTYAVAVNASEVLFYLPSAVGTALLPAVARSGGDAGVDSTLRVFRVVMIVTLAAVGVAAVLGPVLLPLVFGAALRRLGRAVPVAAAERDRLRRQRGLLERAAGLGRARAVVARAGACRSPSASRSTSS